MATKMPTKSTKKTATPKKKTVKTVAKKAPAKVKAPKQTLVWKRTKRGRPKGSVKKSAGQLVNESKAKKNIVTRPDTELSVTQSKFQIGPTHNSGEFQTHNIPFEYGKNRIVLLVVDPKFVFLYWEIQNDKMNEALDKIGHNSKLNLRFHELNTSHSWDVPIYERVGNWYLSLDRSEQNLLVEIGLKNDRGEFYIIASSSPMRLPRMGLAKRGPIKWMLVSPTGEKILTEIEEYTDADLLLLQKILGPYFFDLLRKGKFSGIANSSTKNVFTDIADIRSTGASS